MHPTILAHVIGHFADHPENIATEALSYLLSRSEIVERSFSNFVRSIDHRFTLERLRYSTQGTNSDGSRPDIAGRYGDEVRIFVEAKFWAGLTEAQPVAYLQALSPHAGTLLFITPAARVVPVWQEVRRRAIDFGLPVIERGFVGQDCRSADAGPHCLALISWRVLLDALRAGALAGSAFDIVSDIDQLRSVCEQVDSKAFLPLTSEEMTSTIGRRILQFGELIIDAVARLRDGGGVTVTGAARGGIGWYNRPIFLNGRPCHVRFDADYWAVTELSPLWLDIRGVDWRYSLDVENALNKNGIEFCKGVGCYVPLKLPLGVERDSVIDAIVTQILAIEPALPPVTVAAADPPPEPVDGIEPTIE